MAIVNLATLGKGGKHLDMEWLDFSSKIIQAVFFVILASIAVLTYLQARGTWFQPIRTEVFKEQLRILNELALQFVGKDELELRRELDFNSISEINAYKLLDDYARLYFDIEVDADSRPYNTRDCPITVFRLDTKVITDVTHRTEIHKRDKKPDSRTKPDIWSEYRFEGIRLTRVHYDKFRNIDILSKSPLVPKRCQLLVANYLGTVSKNVELFYDVFDEVSKKLPKLYPNTEALAEVDLMWIQNRYNRKFKLLAPLANQIEDFLRNYLGTDKLLTKQ